MIRSAAWLLAVGLLSLPAPGALAQASGPNPATPAAGATSDSRVGPRPPAPAGVTLNRQGLPLARDAVQRGQRSFKRCNEEALTRKYRGAERRHFVARCRLGYGRRLFRRAAVPPT